MNKTFVTATTLVAAVLGLAACSQQPAPPPVPAPAPPAAAAPATDTPAPASGDSAANGPQGDGEVLSKKP